MFIPKQKPVPYNPVNDYHEIKQEISNEEEDIEHLFADETLPDLPKLVTTYEGHQIEDLEAVGFQTINLLKVASNKMLDKTRFNIPLLDATSLQAVLESMGAQQVKPNLYRIFDQEISIKKDNDQNIEKWYNTNPAVRRGNIKAISLMKHLLAIQENIEEYDNQKSLFIAACQNLNSIQNTAENLHNITEESEARTNTSEISTSAKSPAPQSTPKTASKIDWKQVNEQLNSIPLADVMEFIGANNNEDGHAGQWKVWQTGHNIQVTGNKWYDYNANYGSRGAVSLLAFHYSLIHNIDDRLEENRKKLWKMATSALMQEFKDYGFPTDGMPTETFREPFCMPHAIDFKINDVKNYLHEKRGIPMWIINKQVATGNLFAGYPSDWNPHPHLKNPKKLENENVWAVFLGANGQAAEMRGIARSDNFAKIMAKGGIKETGGFTIKAEKDCSERTVVSLEASIDAMSYHAFYPGRIASSCIGVTFNLAVNAALEALNANYNYVLAFDNDLAGNEAAHRFKETMIEEIGEEEFNQSVAKGQIKFFDLGIKVLQETMKAGKTFYFDVKNNETGRNVVSMFQEQLFNVISKEEIKGYINKGKIKYINICPVFGMIKDAKLEARQVMDLLDSGKPYYLRILADEDEKPAIAEKRMAFEKALNEIAKDKMQSWIKEGKIIFKKEAIAKDWNEFFLYMKQQPEFAEKLKEQEIHYTNLYKEQSNVKNNKGPKS